MMNIFNNIPYLVHLFSLSLPFYLVTTSRKHKPVMTSLKHSPVMTSLKHNPASVKQKQRLAFKRFGKVTEPGTTIAKLSMQGITSGHNE